MTSRSAPIKWSLGEQVQCLAHVSRWPGRVMADFANHHFERRGDQPFVVNHQSKGGFNARVAYKG
ncbi:hypothetical protein [Reyranella sp.]|uniref:hypothetical protein n=1 Tax=Reyranella sp. TaxID=1929291 RepID=UPI0025FD609A|nr:hypothetical protein [Reyranella sp.]